MILILQDVLAVDVGIIYLVEMGVDDRGEQVPASMVVVRDSSWYHSERLLSLQWNTWSSLKRRTST